MYFLCFREQISKGGAGLYPLYFWSKCSVVFYVDISIWYFQVNSGSRITCYVLNSLHRVCRSIAGCSKASLLRCHSVHLFLKSRRACKSEVCFISACTACCWLSSPSLCFCWALLCCTCRLKSPTLFSHLTAKAARVSNTNSELSGYICSGQGC